MKYNLLEYLFSILTIIFITLFSFYTYSFKDVESKIVINDTRNLINIENIENELALNKVESLQEYYNNNDIKGIISIEGVSNFNYPLVQTSDNDYYLNHNYYKKIDSYGAIYADYRVDLNNSNKLLIYGHSSTKKEVPFNKLENYYNKNYYIKNKYITLETKTNTYKYEIFSVYVETNDFTYMNINFNSKEEWYNHILKLQSKSLYKIDVDLTSDDNILIMQTCSTNSNYSKYSKKYLLIVSRRVN